MDVSTAFVTGVKLKMRPPLCKITDLCDLKHKDLQKDTHKKTIQQRQCFEKYRTFIVEVDNKNDGSSIYGFSLLILFIILIFNNAFRTGRVHSHGLQ